MSAQKIAHNITLLVRLRARFSQKLLAELYWYRRSTMRIGLLHIGQPLSMDATVSAHVAQKRLSCLLIVSNINGSPYSQAVLHFLVLHFQRPLQNLLLPK